MAKKRNARDFDAPQLHGDHPRPVTRRQFVAQGFRTGAAYALGGGILSAMAASPRLAQAALSGDLGGELGSCGIAAGAQDVKDAISELGYDAEKQDPYFA